MRIVFLLVLVLHGLIHFMGFAKAFGYADIATMSVQPSKAAGALWFLCAWALLATAVLFLFKRRSWIWIGLPAGVLSQVLIFGAWDDAKFGTIANVAIMLPAIVAISERRASSYGNRYRAAVREGLARSKEMPVVTEADLSHVPAPVQKYLRVSGCVGKPRIQNFRAVFKGKFRNGLQGRWMAFRSEQYNFLDDPARLFLMRSAILGVPAEGFHFFRDGIASMQIRLASLFQVVDAKGPEMNRGETVTFFNDLCLLAPSALIDKARIRWEEEGSLAVRAWFTHRGITISARLSFDEPGNLTGFISDDRFLSADGKTYISYPWSTPVRSYKELDGRKVVGCADAVWHTPQGEFVYGKFNLVEFECNAGPSDQAA